MSTVKVGADKLAKPISGFGTGSAHRLEIRREAIPIVFVPGIMGSRLRNSDDEWVWDPDDKLWMAWTFLTANARERKELAIGKTFSETFLKVNGGNEPDDREMGWTGVLSTSYGAIHAYLRDFHWGPAIKTFFELPVHAFGYNWTASNRSAGKKLATFIDGLKTLYQGKGYECTKVILVTHSMGGLVARSACKLAGAEASVLGIVHGVQPATGAPAAYWRMKAGFERSGGRAVAWVLGSDGEEVTALLANMPGGLQLLPTKNYADNTGNPRWLSFEGEAATDLARPGNGDPYAEIYREKDKFWRLVSPEFLSPGKKPNDTDWEKYLGYLAQAEGFHDDLGIKQHPESWHLFGEGHGHETVHHVTYDVTPYTWIDAITPTFRPNNGGFLQIIKVNEDDRIRVSLREGDGEGDGTVARSSGVALGATCSADDRVLGLSGIAHESSYNEGAAQKFTAKAIRALCLRRLPKP